MNSTICLLSLPLTALLAGAAGISDEAAKEIFQDGVIMVVTTTQLVLKEPAGTDHTYAIDEKTQLSLDGKTCRPQDLKAGLKARVTTDQSEPKSAVSIDAINKNPLFEHMEEGKVVTADNASLVMTADDAKTHTFIVTKDTKVTCDGKKCTAADLLPGTRLRVTKDKSELHVLVLIEAIVDNPDFHQHQ